MERSNGPSISWLGVVLGLLAAAKGVAGVRMVQRKIQQGISPCFEPNGNDLRLAVADYFDQDEFASRTYGNLPDWCVDNVKNFSNVFVGVKFFAEDPADISLAAWNTSSARYMTDMFREARFFTDVSIGNWSVDNVVSFERTFAFSTFNQPLDGWDTSSAETMHWMFAVSPFNQSLSHFSVSKVENFGGMFWGASYFNCPLANWNTQSARDISSMFYGAQFDQDLDHFKVDKVERFEGIFWMSKFNHPLPSWDTRSALDMSNMFAGSPFNHPIDHFKVDNVLFFGGMFWMSVDFNQSLASWNVDNAMDMSTFLGDAQHFEQDLCRWGTHLPNSTRVVDMFYGSGCPIWDDPNMTEFPHGPFCWMCRPGPPPTDPPSPEATLPPLGSAVLLPSSAPASGLGWQALLLGGLLGAFLRGQIF